MSTEVIRRLATTAVAVLAVAAALPAESEAQTKIGVSYQPALYWAVPYFIATEKGWWKEVGLEPNFSTFVAGAPQVAAAPSKSWDVGGTGSAPAVLGAARFNILTIGITNDESAANVVMARGKDADAILRQPSSLKGKQVLLSTNSTGEYSALACLQKWGLSRNDVQIVNLQQQQILSAFSGGEGALAGLWAPNNYRLEESAGAKTVCTGKDAGAVVPGTLVVRADYTKENPDAVAKYLAVYLRSIAWQREHRKETVEMMRRFYSQGGVTIPDKYLEVEIDTRPTFVLAEQLKILDRSGGASQADQWYSKLGEYLKSTGTLTEVPDTKGFITDEFMKRVERDPKLKDFANAR